MQRLPDGACNAHVHVFGPYASFPLAGTRAISPAEAPFEAYARAQAALGFSRGVFSQPSHYGTDNRCLIDALPLANGKARGIVALDPEDLTEREVARLNALGVRGIRVSEIVQVGPSLADIEAIYERIRGSGWHLEINPPKSFAGLRELRGRLERLGETPVIEQMGAWSYPDTRTGVEDEAFRFLLDMVREGEVWVKLSHANHLAPHPHEHVTPFAQALAAANAQRCLFGTDWPHARAQGLGTVPDDALLLELFATWVPQEDVRRTILVDNPDRLYGFSDS